MSIVIEAAYTAPRFGDVPILSMRWRHTQDATRTYICALPVWHGEPDWTHAMAVPVVVLEAVRRLWDEREWEDNET